MMRSSRTANVIARSPKGDVAIQRTHRDQVLLDRFASLAMTGSARLQIIRQ